MKSTQLPQFISQLGADENNPAIRVGKLVWQEKEKFIRWPKQSYLFWPNLKRAAGTGRNSCYKYSESQLETIRAAGLTPRAWTNDPAIFAYKLAGGERPKRADGKWEWNIHHIYDGRFPALKNGNTIHAVQNLNYFTEAAGLVAVHPVADALATEVPYFAWLLRHEAFLRFAFDPDQVFGNSK